VISAPTASIASRSSASRAERRKAMETHPPPERLRATAQRASRAERRKAMETRSKPRINHFLEPDALHAPNAERQWRQIRVRSFSLHRAGRFTRRTPKGNGDGEQSADRLNLGDALHAPNAERQWRPFEALGSFPSIIPKRFTRRTPKGNGDGILDPEQQYTNHPRFTRRTPKGNGDSRFKARLPGLSCASRAERRKAMETRAAEGELARRGSALHAPNAERQWRPDLRISYSRMIRGRFTRRTPKGNGDSRWGHSHRWLHFKRFTRRTPKGNGDLQGLPGIFGFLSPLRFTRRTPKGNGDSRCNSHPFGGCLEALHAPNAERQWRQAFTVEAKQRDQARASRAERRKAMETLAMLFKNPPTHNRRFTRRTPKGNGDRPPRSRASRRQDPSASRAERRKAMETNSRLQRHSGFYPRFTRRTPKGNGDDNHEGR